MFRGAWVLWEIFWHYIINSGFRKKYRVDNKELDEVTKKEYRAKIYKCMQNLSRKMIKAAGTTVEVKGKENLPKSGPVVYMVTHKGLYDTPVFATIVDDPCIFIGKEEMKKMPVMGDWFSATGSIFLARDDMKQSLQAILDGIKELKGGQSLVIFPEGTRSKGEEMGEFKAGSFKLATKAKVPIVPIAIQNTHKVLEMSGKAGIAKATVYVNIGKMIDVPNLSSAELKTLPSDVEDYTRKLLEEVTPRL
ncbi:MAG: lysophospholipid acyltransferase family protein [Cellulosilyticaceae bacterium]